LACLLSPLSCRRLAVVLQSERRVHPFRVCVSMSQQQEPPLSNEEASLPSHEGLPGADPDESILPPIIPTQSVYHIIMTHKGLSPQGSYSPEEAMHRPVVLSDDAKYSLGNLTRQSLPYFLAWKPTYVL
jgi:hypothetical protein